jgi:predicted deacetylase
MSKFVIRIDDVCPTMRWDRFDVFTKALLQAGAPCLIGVVPDCRDPTLFRTAPRKDFWDVIRNLKANGWTIAQHGFTHICDRPSRDWFGLPCDSEFAGHPLETQVERLAAGARILAQEQVATDVFMAPCHAFDLITLEALRKTGFKFVTDGSALWPYKQQELIFVPQLFERPLHFGAGIYTLCYHLDTMGENSFANLLRFVESNKHSIISFDRAEQFVRNDLIARAVNKALKLAQHYRLHWKRRRSQKMS